MDGFNGEYGEVGSILPTAAGQLVDSAAPAVSSMPRSQLKAKFFDFLDENKLIFVVLSGRDLCSPVQLRHQFVLKSFLEGVHQEVHHGLGYKVHIIFLQERKRTRSERDDRRKEYNWK